MTRNTEHPLPFLEEAVRRSPRELAYRTLLAEACLREGDVDRAIEILASSLDASAKPRTIYVLSHALLAAERHGEAKSVATEAVRLNPAMDRAYYVRGRARHAQGDLGGAIADFRTAADGRDEAEYAFALARAAIESATAAPGATAPSVLRHALRALDSLAEREGLARERQHLAALVAFAMDEPATAAERIVARGNDLDSRLALLRGYALLACGRGAEATQDLRVARDVPETNATATRLLTAFRERGRVRPTLAEALLAGGEPAWPDPIGLAAAFLAPPGGSWPPPRGPAVPTIGELGVDAIDLAFCDEAAPAPRTPGTETEGALERARAFLADGKHDAAVLELEYAWDLVRPGTSPIPGAEEIPRHRLQALAEALAAAYMGSERGMDAPRRVRDEELYAAGARFPALLRSLVARLQAEPREDAFALDVLTTAIESEGVLPRADATDVLRRLSAALRLDVEDALVAAAGRVALLERLHRARPGLAFPRLYLGRHSVASGDPQRALVFLGGLSGPLRDAPHVIVLRAECAEAMGDLARALSLYRDAHARAPQLPEVAFRIGRLLMRLDERADGKASGRQGPADPRAAQESLE